MDLINKIKKALKEYKAKVNKDIATGKGKYNTIKNWTKNIAKETGKVTYKGLKGFLDIFGLGTAIDDVLKGDLKEVLSTIENQINNDSKIRNRVVNKLQGLYDDLKLSSSMVGGNAASKIGRRAKEVKDKLDKAERLKDQMDTYDAAVINDLNTAKYGDLIDTKNVINKYNEGGNNNNAQAQFSKEFETYIR